MTSPPEPWIPVRTERLLLRGFRANDRADLHEYASDAEVVRFMEWGPNTEEQTGEWLDRHIQAQADPQRADIVFAIKLRDENKLIGTIALHLREESRSTAELGYCLNRLYWQRGIMSEAARAVVSAGFAHLGLHRIWATCNAQNHGSAGVLQSIGMQREGLLRRDRRVKGEWRDTLMYAVLAEEWRG